MRQTYPGFLRGRVFQSRDFQGGDGGISNPDLGVSQGIGGLLNSEISGFLSSRTSGLLSSGIGRFSNLAVSPDLLLYKQSSCLSFWGAGITDLTHYA